MSFILDFRVVWAERADTPGATRARKASPRKVRPLRPWVGGEHALALPARPTLTALIRECQSRALNSGLLFLMCGGGFN